jgi:hypothetical protein
METDNGRSWRHTAIGSIAGATQKVIAAINPLLFLSPYGYLMENRRSK